MKNLFFAVGRKFVDTDTARGDQIKAVPFVAIVKNDVALIVIFIC